MAAFIFLDDGRSLYRSNLAFGGMLQLISEQVSSVHSKLKIWLADASKRPAPFMDFDVRGFSEADRAEFYAAAQRAFEQLLISDPDPFAQTGSVEALTTLLRMKRSIDNGEPPTALTDSEHQDFDGSLIDLSQIWDDINNEDGDVRRET